MDNLTTNQPTIPLEIHKKDNPLQFMTAEDVAKLLMCDPSKIRRMARNGKIPFIKFGGSWVIRRVILEKYINELENG